MILKKKQFIYLSKFKLGTKFTYIDTENKQLFEVIDKLKKADMGDCIRVHVRELVNEFFFRNTSYRLIYGKSPDYGRFENVVVFK